MDVVVVVVVAADVVVDIATAAGMSNLSRCDAFHNW